MAKSIDEILSEREDIRREYKFYYDDGSTSKGFIKGRELNVVAARLDVSMFTDCYNFENGFLENSWQDAEDWGYLFDADYKLVRERSWDKQGLPGDDEENCDY